MVVIVFASIAPRRAAGNVFAAENSLKVDLGNDITVCVGLPEYLWSDGSTNPWLEVASSGKYWLQSQNVCGLVSDTIKVIRRPDIFIPNVVTSNNDDLNGKFVIQQLGEPIETDITILDRWGNDVFVDRAYHGAWPEESQNIISGIYYYQCRLGGCQPLKGWVHVLKDD